MKMPLFFVIMLIPFIVIVCSMQQSTVPEHITSAGGVYNGTAPFREKNVYFKNHTIRLYQADYSRENLQLIAGIGSTDTADYSVTWKVGQELIEVQKKFTEDALRAYIVQKNLQECADYYIKELYNPSFKKPLLFASYELYPLDEKKEKWVIFFIYEEEKDRGKGYWNEVVFMMPDGTIIISENNFEEIAF